MIRKFQKECESSSEYILPDYLGDVKKLMMTSARAVPSGSFDGDEQTECAGIVAYDVVYLDSENKLSAASFTSDYDFSFPKNGESYLDAFVSSGVGNFSLRLTGPRRIIAKSYVVSDVFLMESFEPTVSGSAFSESDALEKITKTLSVGSSVKAENLEREYAEEIASLEGVPADEIEVITSSAYVRISESTPVDGGVNIKGELIVTAIIRTPDTSVFAIRREIPFDETVSIVGGGEDMSAIGEASVTSLNIGISETEGCSELVANAIMDFSALAFYNENVEITKDAYLKTKNTKEEYKNLDFRTHLSAETKSGSISLKMPLLELDTPNLKEILALNQDFRNVGLENDGKSTRFVGEAAFSGVACEISEDGDTSISNLKFTAPINVDVNISCQFPEKHDFFAKISPAGCDWEIDGENLCVKVYYTYSYSLSETLHESCLSSCEIVGDELIEKSLSKVSVYYPDPDESLFEIAKKFHTGVKDIAEDNAIGEPCALGIPVKSGYRKLIIR